MKRRFVEASPKKPKQKKDLPDPLAPPAPPTPAMNPAKLREIADGLSSTPATRLLIVSGPAGCSKSTAVHYLANQQNLQIKEFSEPEREPMEAFGDFLLGCSLLSSNHLILIDDLPNLSHPQTLEKFQQSLKWWLGLATVPLLVVVFTEVEFEHYGESYLVGRIFSMLDDPRVRHIKCLPISPRFLGAALKLHTQSKTQISILSQLGDIRQALRGLEFGHAKDTKNTVFHRVGQVVWGSKNVEPMDLLGSDLDAHVFENYAKRDMPLETLGECAEALSAANAFSLNDGSLRVHAALSRYQSGKKMIPMTLYKRRAPDPLQLFGEWSFVRDHATASLRDVALDRSLGLENKRPPLELDFSSDED